LTPLGVPEILAFSKAGIDPNAFPVYRWRRG